jgi:hypothetical protein
MAENFVIYSFKPGLKLFMSFASMHGSDYLLQENKMEAIEPMLGTHSISTPGLKSSM